MAHRLKVKQGQVYVDLPSNRPGSRLWKVESLCENAMQIPHARLIDVSDPVDTKTISCHALINRAHYELVSEPTADSC